MSGAALIRIRSFDCVEQLRELRGEILEAVERVLTSGRLILGPEVAEFEREFSGALGGGHSVGVSSGTDALVVALLALGVGPGDEVVTVANTAVPTVSAIRSVGARPVFCDVEPESGLLDPAQLQVVLSERTRAVIPVHLFGNVADVAGVREALGGRRLPIVEDCAQAFGASRGGRPAGSLGDAAAFSFYPTKNLAACGDGGMCHTRDAALAERMRRIRQYGLDDERQALIEGVNARLDELQAAILRVKLRHLDAHQSRRRALAARYDKALGPRAWRVARAPDVGHAYHLYAVRVPEREKLRGALAAQGIETAVHYPTPIHRMPAYRLLAGRRALPHTERWAREVLSLPLYPELPDAAADEVAERLNRLLEALPAGSAER